MSEMILERALEALGADEVDLYPSRNGQNAKIVDRQDPVVYAPKDQPPRLTSPISILIRSKGLSC